MQADEILDSVKTFAGSTAGRVVLLGAVGIGAVVVISRSRRTSVQSATGTSLPTGGIVASQIGQSGGGGSSDNPALAEIEAQKSLIAAQTEAQKDLANFGLELSQKQQAATLQAQTAQFDAQYSGNDVSMLEYAGIGSFNTVTGQALTATKSPRTRPVPVSGYGLESGVPSNAGQSVLDAIADALGLGVAQGESRASVLARLSNYQAGQATARDLETLQAQDQSYLQRLRTNYELSSEAMAQQYQQSQQLQQDQIKAQERANNPFSSIGNFFKSAGSIVAGLRSVQVPSVSTPPINPNPTRPTVTASGNYALLEPAYRAVQSIGGVPGGDGSMFIGVA